MAFNYAYTQSCPQLGITSAQSQSTLIKHHGDVNAPSTEMLYMWGTSSVEKANLSAQCGIIQNHVRNGAAPIIRERRMLYAAHEETEKYDEGTTSIIRERKMLCAAHEETEIYDEGAALIFRERRMLCAASIFRERRMLCNYAVREAEGESDKAVAVYQSGGSPTINASGRSQVTGNTMNGPVTNIIINYYPAEASTQSQGRKRKADVSSGDTKRVKMSGYR